MNYCFFLFITIFTISIPTSTPLVPSTLTQTDKVKLIICANSIDKIRKNKNHILLSEARDQIFNYNTNYTESTVENYLSNHLFVNCFNNITSEILKKYDSLSKRGLDSTIEKLMDVPSIIKMYKENNREEIVSQVKEGKALTKLITESDVFNLGQSSSSGDFSLFGFSFNKLSKKHKNIIGLVFIVIVICILVYLCRLVLVKKEQPKKKKKKEKTK